MFTECLINCVLGAREVGVVKRESSHSYEAYILLAEKDNKPTYMSGGYSNRKKIPQAEGQE